VTAELRDGGLIRLRASPVGVLGWAIPAWAILCGAIASEGLTLTLSAGVRLLMTVLLVEAGWGTVWGALTTTDWTTPLRRWRNWRVGDPLPFLPYTRPGSPGDRLSRWLSQLLAWGRAVLAPTVGPAVGTVLFGLLLSLVLAAAEGLEPTLLTLAALALMQLALVLDRGRGRPPAVWDAVLRVGLPWMAGHLAFGPLTLPSVLLAAAFSGVVTSAGTADRQHGRILWTAGQIAVALLLLALHRPIAALFLALFLIPQWLLAIGAEEANPEEWPRRTWAWLAVGMVLAAGVV